MGREIGTCYRPSGLGFPSVFVWDVPLAPRVLRKRCCCLFRGQAHQPSVDGKGRVKERNEHTGTSSNYT